MGNLFENYNKAFESTILEAQLESLLEAMSPEDKADTELIRSVQRKIANRSNAKLTPEEQAVLDKYGIIRHDHTLAVGSETDKNGWYRRSELPTPEKASPMKQGKAYWDRSNKPDEVNLADMARKLGSRLDRDAIGKDEYGNPLVLVGQERRGVKHNPDNYKNNFYTPDNRLSMERRAQGAAMSNDVSTMKQALKDRNYHQKNFDAADDEYTKKRADLIAKHEKELADLDRSTKWNKDYHDRGVKSADNTIQKTLNKYKKEESLEESAEPSFDIKSDLYNTLAELAFKYHKADKPFTQEDFDQAYEWFSVHFFEDEFPIED